MEGLLGLYEEEILIRILDGRYEPPYMPHARYSMHTFYYPLHRALPEVTLRLQASFHWGEIIKCSRPSLIPSELLRNKATLDVNESGTIMIGLAPE